MSPAWSSTMAPGRQVLTTFHTTIDWCDNASFRLFETVVYHWSAWRWWTRRFKWIRIPADIPQGHKPAYFDKEALRCRQACGHHPKGKRMTDNTTPYEMDIKDTKCRGTVWTYSAIRDNNGLRKTPGVHAHRSGCQLHAFTPDSIVLDPMSGREPPSWQPPLLGLHWYRVEPDASITSIGWLKRESWMRYRNHSSQRYTRDDIKYLEARQGTRRVIKWNFSSASSACLDILFGASEIP